MLLNSSIPTRLFTQAAQANPLAASKQGYIMYYFSLWLVYLHPNLGGRECRPRASPVCLFVCRNVLVMQKQSRPSPKPSSPISLSSTRGRIMHSRVCVRSSTCVCASACEGGEQVGGGGGRWESARPASLARPSEVEGSRTVLSRPLSLVSRLPVAPGPPGGCAVCFLSPLVPVPPLREALPVLIKR